MQKYLMLFAVIACIAFAGEPSKLPKVNHWCSTVPLTAGMDDADVAVWARLSDQSINELAAEIHKRLGPHPTNYVEMMRQDGSLTNIVQSLIADGTVCAVHGKHEWSDAHDSYAEMSRYLVLVTPGYDSRSCRICGKAETRDTRWPSEKRDLSVTSPELQEWYKKLIDNSGTTSIFFTNLTLGTNLYFR